MKTIKFFLFLCVFSLLALPARAKNFEILTDQLSTPEMKEAHSHSMPVTKKNTDKIEIFLSLSCPGCRKTWLNMTALREFRDWMYAEDAPIIYGVPVTRQDGPYAMIYEFVREKNPGDAAEYLSLLYLWRKDHVNRNEWAGRTNAWLQKNGYPKVEEIVGNQQILQKLAQKIGEQRKLADSYGLTAYPSLFINGKEIADRSRLIKLPGERVGCPWKAIEDAGSPCNKHFEGMWDTAPWCNE